MRFDVSVFVSSVSFSKNKKLRKKLLEHFPNAQFNDSLEHLSKAKLKDLLSKNQAAIIGLDSIDQDVLSACPNLNVISKFGVGLDNIDFLECEKRNIQIRHQQGVNRRSVSEQTISFMIGLFRNIFLTNQVMKNGKWEKSGGRQLTGKTIGLVGFGNIGKDVAYLLQPYECKVLVVDILDKSNEFKSANIKQVSFEYMLSCSDLISLHVPLTNLTREMISFSEVTKMKKGVFVINTSRGQILNLKALKSGIRNGHIAGAALDVYEEEPFCDRELIEMPQVVCTPHIGGNAIEAVEAMGDAAIANLVEYYKEVR